MTLSARYHRVRTGMLAIWRHRGISRKAITFALVGVVNTVADYCVFLLARSLLGGTPAAVAAISSFADFCHCGTPATISLVAANICSWSVAVTGSYVMNSSITFAAETGRKLTRRAYLTFLASSVVGWFANTLALLFAAEILLLPIWLAKAAAILASFVVNFSFSHFVVFRVRPQPARDASEGP